MPSKSAKHRPVTRPTVAVSVRTNPEAEEAVGLLLERLTGAPPSTWLDETTRSTTVSVYLDQSRYRDSLRAALKNGLAQVAAAGLNTSPAAISIRTIRPQDWAESWKTHFKPIQIGRALLIRPGWSRRKPRPGEALVVLDPGLSFGTGQHATTAFCLEQLVACRVGSPQSFLDIGSGSGILAIAAAKLGYEPVRAFDCDPEAVRIATTNAGANNVDKTVRPARRDLTRLPLRARTQFDVICANLVHDLLLSEAEKIVNRLKPSGSLVLAGILKSQFRQVREHYETLGLKRVRERIEGEWHSGLFRFPPDTAKSLEPV